MVWWMVSECMGFFIIIFFIDSMLRWMYLWMCFYTAVMDGWKERMIDGRCMDTF